MAKPADVKRETPLVKPAVEVLRECLQSAEPMAERYLEFMSCNNPATPIAGHINTARLFAEAMVKLMPIISSQDLATSINKETKQLANTLH